MKYISYFFTGLLLIIGCKEKFLVTPVTTNNLVVNGFFTYGDSCWFNVSNLERALGIDSNTFCNNAEVIITDPSGKEYQAQIPSDVTQDMDILTMFNNDKGYYLLNDRLPYQTGLYKLTVNVPGRGSVSAFDSIPVPVHFSIANAGIHHKTNPLFLAKIDDPAGLENYYSMFGFAEYYWGNSATRDLQDARLNCPNSFVEAFYDTQVFFSDKSFDGRQQNIDLECYGAAFDWLIVENKQLYTSPVFDDINKLDSVTFKIYLQSISKAYYDYVISVYKQSVAEHDFYADPVSVYSNIVGGKGIFAGYSYSTASYTIRHK